MQVKDKTILITGGANGIGLETVRLLAKQGARLIVVDVDAPALTRLKQELPDCFIIEQDLAALSELPALVTKLAPMTTAVDILINNAGVGCHGPLAELSPADIEYVLRLNTTAPAVLMRLLCPSMNKGSVVVNVGSPAAAYTTPGFSIYSGSKNALASITRIARKEYSKQGIKVVLFYPFITWSSYAKHAIYTPSFARWTRQNLPAYPDTAAFAAKRLVASLATEKSVFKARPDWYFLFALVRQKLR